MAMIKVIPQVTIRNVGEEDWRTLTQIAEDANMTMAELIHVLAEGLKGKAERQSVLGFLSDQRRRRQEFMRGLLFGQEKKEGGEPERNRFRP